MNLLHTVLMNVLTYVLNRYGLKGFLVAAVFGMLAIDNYEKRQELASLKEELKTCKAEKEALKAEAETRSRRGNFKSKKKTIIYEEGFPFFNSVIASWVRGEFPSDRHAHYFVTFDYDPVD